MLTRRDVNINILLHGAPRSASRLSIKKTHTVHLDSAAKVCIFIAYYVSHLLYQMLIIFTHCVSSFCEVKSAKEIYSI